MSTKRRVFTSERVLYNNELRPGGVLVEGGVIKDVIPRSSLPSIAKDTEVRLRKDTKSYRMHWALAVT